VQRRGVNTTRQWKNADGTAHFFSTETLLLLEARQRCRDFFTDSGLGTGPLVSYDQKYFYIIYGALFDNNLKIYVSADQGQTWSGPNIVVPGNAYSSPTAGPLSYQGTALTCPGTNVGIDGSGKIHVLYIDSTKSLPMYTSSSNHGSTWSTPVNVDPGLSNDVHMFPCLCCNKNGDIQAGSMVYAQTSSRYMMLEHAKAANATVWTTTEMDNGAWQAAGPSPKFRIGFGDYFDCDCLPQNRMWVAAWSETPNGQQPWQTWVSGLLDPCRIHYNRLVAIEDEIENLMSAFDAEEIPMPRTKGNIAKFLAMMGQLRRQRASLLKQFEGCRLAYPLP
jgi:hypothetical protein